MPEPRPAAPAEAPAPPLLDYVTRLIPTPTLTSARVLPYVEEAIRTVGFGSAVAFGDRAIQVTMPTQLMGLLESTINAYEREPDQFQDYREREFYPPAIRVKVADTSFRDLVVALGLCPPDMRLAWIGLGDSGALMVSGPSAPARKDHYRDAVLPALKTLAAQLTPPFATPFQ